MNTQQPQSLESQTIIQQPTAAKRIVSLRLPGQASILNSASVQTPTWKPTTAPADKICWQSNDGLVVIRQLVRHAKRNPPSDYPCIVLEGYPQEHQRVRALQNRGIELMLTHEELEQLISAFNAVAESEGKGKLYEILQRVPPKTEARKAKWRQFNEARFASSHSPTRQDFNRPQSR